MRWRQRRAVRLELEQARQERQQLQLEARLSLHRAMLLEQVRVLLREQLWEMALPLAEALHRQDSLAEERHRLLLGHLLVLQDQTETRGLLAQDLLLEVLGSLQPPASQQLLPRLALPLTSSSPSSER
jgi:hypothetical protein